MPDFRRARCKKCEGHRGQVGPISWAGFCQSCAIDAVTENIVGLATATGEPLQRWRRGMVASAGGFLLDDDPAGK